MLSEAISIASGEPRTPPARLRKAITIIRPEAAVRSCTWLVVCHADQIDLDQRVLDQQAGRTDRVRWRDFEIFLPRLVEAVEVVEVGEEDLRLADLV
jgi:hypothetical protein